MNLQEFTQSIAGAPCSRLDGIARTGSILRQDRINQIRSLDDIRALCRAGDMATLQLRWRYEDHGEIHLAFGHIPRVFEWGVSGQNAMAWAFTRGAAQEIGHVHHASLRLCQDDLFRGNLVLMR